MQPLLVTLLLAIFCFLPQVQAADEFNLPELGNSTSSIVSSQEEYRLGQYWLRAFRQQASTVDDPLLYTYLHNLIQNLAFHSTLNDKSFDLILVNDKSFNAFAVPGQVIGVNAGLFLYADTEDQLASVLGHELAHLSQRHYARSVESSKQRGLLTLAGLLGGLLIAVAGHADAGFAAISATQAAAISNQLKYSRIHEQEADRVGIHTLASAGYNPNAMAQMFQHLLVLTRYRQDFKDFEFLLTHPITDSRVADSLNMAKQYPATLDKDSLAFHLMKARAYVYYSQNPKNSVTYFLQQTDKKTRHPEAIQYGLALAYLQNNQVAQAEPIIAQLYQQQPLQTAFFIAHLQLLTQKNQWQAAYQAAENELSLRPNNYPLAMFLAASYSQQKQYADAVRILRPLAQSEWGSLPEVWLQLAEMEGMAGNITEVHLARAEYFMRVGAFRQAQRHWTQAKTMLQDNLLAVSRIDVKIEQAASWERQRPF